MAELRTTDRALCTTYAVTAVVACATCGAGRCSRSQWRSRPKRSRPRTSPRSTRYEALTAVGVPVTGDAAVEAIPLEADADEAADKAFDDCRRVLAASVVDLDAKVAELSEVGWRSAFSEAMDTSSPRPNVWRCWRPASSARRADARSPAA